MTERVERLFPGPESPSAAAAAAPEPDSRAQLEPRARLSAERFEWLIEESRKGGSRFEIDSDSPDPTVALLRDSGFRPLRWHERPAADHARSKTFRVLR